MKKEEPSNHPITLKQRIRRRKYQKKYNEDENWQRSKEAYHRRGIWVISNGR